MRNRRLIGDSIMKVLDSRGLSDSPNSYDQGLTCKLETINNEEIPTLTIRPAGEDNDFSGGLVTQLMFNNDGDILIRRGDKKWSHPVRLVTEKNERPEDGKIYIDNSGRNGIGSSHRPLSTTEGLSLNGGDTVVYTATRKRYDEIIIENASNVSLKSRKGKAKIAAVKIMHGVEGTYLKNLTVDNIEIYSNEDIIIKGCNIESLIINSTCDCKIIGSNVKTVYTNGECELTFEYTKYNKLDADPKSKIYRITKNIEIVQ